MADKYHGTIKAGSTSVTTTVVLLSETDGTAITGLVAADCTATYRRQGGTRATITLADLAAIDSAWASGGFKEDVDGAYRLDVPDAALATGADFALLNVQSSGSFVFRRELALETKGAGEVYTLLGTVNTATAAIKVVTDQLTIASGKVAAQITAAGDLAQAAADKVWASATRTLSSYGTLVADAATAVWVAGGRTLTSFGFTVSLATSVWDEVAASHVTPGTTGETLGAAASAGDPWITALPGAYAAGTAGHRVGTNLDAAVSSVSVGTIPSAAQVAAAVRAIVVETDGNVTLHEALSVVLAAVAGVTDDDGRTRKTAAGTATRAVGTFNDDGERTAVTLTPSA